MSTDSSDSITGWDEQSSRTFIDYGRYFVPDREQQMQTICDLIPPRAEPSRILELCCGAGLLAEALLERFPNSSVHGLDGSPEMLRAAQSRLVRYGSRFTSQSFDLAASEWRVALEGVDAVVSSLAIHHLDDQQKQTLFADVYRMLRAGGVFVVADLMRMAHPLGAAVAAHAWDEAVRQRSLALDGSTAAFELFERERWNMYRYFDPDDIDKPSRLFDQLLWLSQAGFVDVDVYWLNAGHAIFGGRKA